MSASDLEVRPLRVRERDPALAELARAPLANLLLIDAVERLGRPPVPGEMRAQVVAAWRGGTPAALASLQPAIAVSDGISSEGREALLPYLVAPKAGLVKCPEATAGPIWRRLAAQGRVAMLDRIEIAFAVTPGELREPTMAALPRVRPASHADLPALIEAARASLREEGRPDPFEGDVEGFRRWVASRVGRALVAELDAVPRFAAYADVQSPHGWLLQGVYTWPAQRRRGLAAAGVAALCQRAFAEGADHVQLAVVEGNAPAEKLYASLGFRPFARLRTVLFR